MASARVSDWGEAIPDIHRSVLKPLPAVYGPYFGEGFRFRNFTANIPKVSANNIPKTGTMMVSGGHKPTVSMGKKADNSSILLEAIWLTSRI
jgi:hypothetical protein